MPKIFKVIDVSEASGETLAFYHEGEAKTAIKLLGIGNRFNKGIVVPTQTEWIGFNACVKDGDNLNFLKVQNVRSEKPE
jgi:hypothetical protein